MEYTGTATVEFDAGHFLPDDARCGIRHHGHRYTVSATFTGRIGQDGRVDGVDRLLDDLKALTSEFDNRDIHEMMPGVITDVHGVARYIMERLVGDWKSLVSVTVSNQPSTSGKVTREIAP